MTVKKKLTLLLVIILCLSSWPVQGESYPFTGITSAALNLRSGASVTTAVLITIPRGKTVTVTGKRNNFYAVQYGSYSGYASCDYITTAAPTPDNTVNPDKGNAANYYTEITASSTASEITALQEALKELGFYTSSIDGKYGNGTRNAVLAFQKSNSLTQTGTANALTLQLLFDGSPKNSKGKTAKVNTLPPVSGVTISKGAKGEQVKNLQLRLQELGYLSSKADGECGSATVNAIKAFQKKMGFTETGEADTTLQAVIYSSAALSAKAVLTPAPTKEAAYPYTTVTLAAVNLRKAASVSSTRITTVPKGASVTVNKATGDYLYITYKSYQGYIMAQYADVPVQYLEGTVLAESLQATINYTQIDNATAGKSVDCLQEALKELGFYTGAMDGIFGSGMLSAVKAFQKANGLRQDGIVTPELQQYLYESKVKNSKGVSTNVTILPPIDGIAMEKGDRGYQVSALQEKLATLGYYTGSITGTYDNATVNAVKAFQKANSLTQDGKAGTKTLSALSRLTATATPYVPQMITPEPVATPITRDNVIVIHDGTRGQVVRALQEALTELGYYYCTPDGIYDSDDIAAVKAFQKNNGLKADGIAGYDTQILLYSGNAKPYFTGTPTPTAVPTASPKATAAPSSYPLLKQGSKGDNVTRLQNRLKELNYYSGTADGIYGEGTAKAVKAFQKANGLTQDGQAGSATQKKLYSTSAKAAATAKPTATPTPAPAVLKLGSTGDDVKKLQKRLIELGYLTGSADGSFGYKTYSALIAFQQRNSLAGDGVAGTATQTKLYSSSAVRAPAGTTSPLVTPTPKPGFTAPKASEVRYANWYTEIRAVAKMMPDVVIYDPDTGLHYNLHLFSQGKHADAETPTAQDTAIMNQVCGTNSWTPHAVWVIFSDGRVYLASTHSHGHEVDHTSGNNLEGHICVHFPRVMSEAEETGPYAVSHQKAILLGWEKIESLTGNKK